MVSAKITCVLFDMDNTLIDWSKTNGNWGETERHHLEHVFSFLHEQGRVPNGSFDYVLLHYRERVMDAWADSRATQRAPSMSVILKATLTHFGISFDDMLTIEHVLQAYKWRGMDDVVTFPDVPPALQQLLDMGIKIGILTNAFQPMWMRDAELERFGLLQYFPHQHTRMSAADLGYLKPSPIVFRKALANMGTTAAETIYVGDSLPADVVGAQSVGMRAVLREIHDTPSLAHRLVMPDAVIKVFDELLPLVEDWDESIKLQRKRA
jgi:FMN phosphatase YigB (HAD superfamily)